VRVFQARLEHPDAGRYGGYTVDKSLTLNNSASVCAGFPRTPATVPFSLPPVDQKGAPAKALPPRNVKPGGK
jgi:hypothetical protein